ncbi:MAG: sensor histidine kinase, partial [bacterium]
HESLVKLNQELQCEINERARMQHELARAKKLASVGHLAAGIAHEINTPTQYVGDNIRFLKEVFADLNNLIISFDELLQGAKEKSVDADLVAKVETAARKADVDYLTEEVTKAIDQSLEGIERVARIVRAMKEFSHPNSDEKQPVDLNRLIESTLTVSRNEWKYVADLKTDYDPDLPLVPCLAGEFNQAILNLVVNASQAIAETVADCSNERGTITVRTRLVEKWAEIRITDTGTGIPEPIQEKVFDHFFTTKEVGKGTGQGLTIAHSIIVEKHGGTITFDSAAGRGTTFIIQLPIRDRGSQNEADQSAALETAC